MLNRLDPPVSAPASASSGRISERLGVVAAAGFQPLPDVLLFHQSELRLRSEDLNVLLNVMAHWYHPGQMPFLRLTTIAKRMGVSTRSVQRSIQRLRELDLIRKGMNEEGRETYDVSPLIDRLSHFAVKRIIVRDTYRNETPGMA